MPLQQDQSSVQQAEQQPKTAQGHDKLALLALSQCEPHARETLNLPASQWYGHAIKLQLQSVSDAADTRGEAGLT